jgi:hypothetical protein
MRFKKYKTMNTQNFNQDQFALFIANKILKTENYNFDYFYDIAYIVELINENRQHTESPNFKTFYLYTRNLGSHLSEDKNDDLLLNNDQAYKITLCFNYQYFTNQNFATVEQIK